MTDTAAAPSTRPRLLWAPRAWLPGGWREGVLARIGADGCWERIETNAPRPAAHEAAEAGVNVLDAPILPGLVDAHGHAFQRAFAGLAERRESDSDDFWSWRDRMYGVAGRITSRQLRAVASHLYVELLRGGYTQACEFHYVHRQPDGTPGADPLEMSRSLVDASQRAGIGLTMLPVLYERAGFAQPAPRPDQRRFITSARWVRDAAAELADSARRSPARASHPPLRAGLAIHSLRAVSPESIAQLLALAGGFDGPIHVHVAEQTAEVDDCIAATGLRPIEWLARHAPLDRRWQLVHATHALRNEIDAVAASGAGVVICPSTEANLGDGLPDLAQWLDAGVPITIGSDSHVTRAWREELRWLEYGQRLVQRRRNVVALPGAGQPATAARLFDRVVQAGAGAAGEPAWGLVPGARADVLVVDLGDASLAGVPPSHLLDALVFSSPGRPWRDVMVAGQWVVRDHRHPGAAAIAAEFADVMNELWQPRG